LVGQFEPHGGHNLGRTLHRFGDTHKSWESYSLWNPDRIFNMVRWLLRLHQRWVNLRSFLGYESPKVRRKELSKRTRIFGAHLLNSPIEGGKFDLMEKGLE